MLKFSKTTEKTANWYEICINYQKLSNINQKNPKKQYNIIIKFLNQKKNKISEPNF